MLSSAQKLRLRWYFNNIILYYATWGWKSKVNGVCLVLNTALLYPIYPIPVVQRWVGPGEIGWSRFKIRWKIKFSGKCYGTTCKITCTSIFSCKSVQNMCKKAPRVVSFLSPFFHIYKQKYVFKHTHSTPLTQRQHIQTI